MKPLALSSRSGAPLAVLAHADALGHVHFGWEESKHPRAPRGTDIGGRWVSEGRPTKEAEKEVVESHALLVSLYGKEQLEILRRSRGPLNREDMLSAVSGWQESDYRLINAYLRQVNEHYLDMPLDIKAKVSLLDKFVGVPLKKDIYVYRGVLGSKMVNRMQLGKRPFSDPGFLATATSLSGAMYEMSGSSQRYAIMRLKVLAGTKIGLPSEALGRGVGEVLLPRGMTITSRRVYRERGVDIIEAEVSSGGR